MLNKNFKYLKILALVTVTVMGVLIFIFFAFNYFCPNGFNGPVDPISEEFEKYLATTPQRGIDKIDVFSKKSLIVYSLNFIFVMSFFGFCVCLLDLDSVDVTEVKNCIKKL